MTSGTVLAELDALIARRTILAHPFYQAWTAGTLTRSQLASYARVYYPHVAAFPDYLRAAREGASLASIREELGDNLHEELHVPAPHSELWIRFASALGVEQATMVSTPPTASTQTTIAAFRDLCGRDTASALAALYAYESQQPEVSRQKSSGLQQHYGVHDREALSYFDVHAEADVRHRDGERRALAACLENGATRDGILDAANAACDAYWSLLDGVCSEVGIVTTC
jgi:pyrroloquinoline-quinone synthase